MVNSITVYRLVAAFFLLFFVVEHNLEVFRWLLVVSFFSDAIDGYLARRYKVTSTVGSRLDSIADDLTVLMAIMGVFIFRPGFIQQQLAIVIVLFVLYLLQLTMALVRYGRISSFHTYLAKGAAVFQGVFLVLIFFLPQWPLYLFYIAAGLTILDLAEEIMLVILLPTWQTDVKGLYWVLRKGRIGGRQKGIQH